MRSHVDEDPDATVELSNDIGRGGKGAEESDIMNYDSHRVCRARQLVDAIESKEEEKGKGGLR